MNEILKDRVAVITGGGTGIGRGIALALAKEEAISVLCGRRPAPLEDAAAEVVRKGGKALPIQADVSSEADVDRLFKTVVDTFGRFDILINNAAIAEGAATYEVSTETWDRGMDINLRGPFLMIRAALPLMRVQRRGHIINISSESGIEYYEGDMPYGLTKHALNDLGEYIQRENQEFGIRVNTICPGMVVTDMTKDSVGLDHSKCLYPEDIADLALWLLTRRQNIKIGTPILIQTMLNPWE